MLTSKLVTKGIIVIAQQLRTCSSHNGSSSITGVHMVTPKHPLLQFWGIWCPFLILGGVQMVTWQIYIHDGKRKHKIKIERKRRTRHGKILWLHQNMNIRTCLALQKEYWNMWRSSLERVYSVFTSALISKYSVKWNVKTCKLQRRKWDFAA